MFVINIAEETGVSLLICFFSSKTLKGLSLEWRKGPYMFREDS